jgi:hypothetical protein
MLRVEEFLANRGECSIRRRDRKERRRSDRDDLKEIWTAIATEKNGIVRGGTRLTPKLIVKSPIVIGDNPMFRSKLAVDATILVGFISYSSFSHPIDDLRNIYASYLDTEFNPKYLLKCIRDFFPIQETTRITIYEFCRGESTPHRTLHDFAGKTEICR